jgi:hypothetical protein
MGGERRQAAAPRQLDHRRHLTMTLPDVLRWMGRAPAERASLPASGVLWTAAEILHAAHIAPMEVGLAAAAVAGITYGKVKGSKHGAAVAAGVSLTGAWLTIATDAGPLGWQWHGFPGLSMAWLAGSVIGYIALRRHERIAAAREWRNAREDWLRHRAPAWGLHGSHLLEHEFTRLGEAWTADVTGTGKHASSLSAGDLAEWIAERERLPVSRVRVTAAAIAGRVRISVRRQDPWKDAIPHPVLTPQPEIDLPVPCTVREPLIVGQDPETGRPLKLPVWHKRGARNVLIVGIKEAGKTVLLNCVRERLTAAADAVTWDVNVSKALQDAEWSPACPLAAVGPAQRKRALAILLCARGVIDYRGSQPRDVADLVPSPEQPLIAVIIDEIDALISGGDHLAAAIKTELSYIASKGRSEAVALIIAGQRATADWIGGANLRSQIDLVCVGKVSRAAEMHHVGDVGLMLPDMATYGAGHPGVWAIAELGGAHELGRTFNLESPTDLRVLAHARAAHQPELEADLAEYLGSRYAQLRESQGARPRRGTVPAATQAAGESYPPVTDGPSPVATATLDPGSPDSIDALDSGLDDMLPPDLRERLRKMDVRRAETADILRECDEIAASLPEVDPERLAEARAERWAQEGARAVIPTESLGRLLALLAEGTTTSAAAADLDVSKWIMRTWLERLRSEGKARTEGKGRGTRWRSVTPDRDSQ